MFQIKTWPVLIALATAFLVVAGGCGKPAPTGPSINQIVIASTPESGAQITIDGVPVGETPKILKGYEGKGIVIVLTKEGFKDKKDFRQVPESGEHRFVIEIEPRVGYVTIESKPQGATVYLNETILLGDTPLIRHTVPIGTQHFKFVKDNFEIAYEEKEVKEDYRYTLLSVLRSLPARVSIFAMPSGAEIWINDERQGETAPAQFDLSPGEYTFGVHVEGYIMQEESVILSANQKLDLNFKLEPGQIPPGMVLVPAGEFLMGTDGRDPDERPQRTIRLDSYYIDKNEVTNAQFREVFPQYKFELGFEKYPMAGVTWRQAVEYAKAVGKRLPTEAEWEKAARGDDGQEYPWGNNFDKSRCNSAETYGARLKKTGSHRSGVSPFGCMDMAGNVREWTSTWYEAYPGNTAVSARYGQVYRVLRGGSYLTKRPQVRCPARHMDREEKAEPDYGFRCAKDVN